MAAARCISSFVPAVVAAESSKELVALRLDVLFQPFDRLAVVPEQVALVRRDDLRTRCERRGVVRKLAVDRLKILDGVAPLAAGYVHNVNEQAAAVDVPEKSWPRPAPSLAPSMMPGMSASTKEAPSAT